MLADDVYWHLCFGDHKLVPFVRHADNWKRTITIFSAGKMLNCTGWKVGWAIGPQQLIQQALFSHEAATFTNNVPG